MSDLGWWDMSCTAIDRRIVVYLCAAAAVLGFWLRGRLRR